MYNKYIWIVGKFDLKLLFSIHHWSTFLLSQFLNLHCNQCALVSSSGQMLGSAAGEQIDKINCVIRMNNAPTQGYEKDVGSRTSIRVVSHTSVPLLVKNEHYYFQQSANTAYVIWGPDRNMRQDGKGPIYNTLVRIARKYPNVGIYIVTREKIHSCDRVFQNETGKNRYSLTARPNNITILVDKECYCSMKKSNRSDALTVMGKSSTEVMYSGPSAIAGVVSQTAGDRRKTAK